MTTGEWSCLISFAWAPPTFKEGKQAKNSKWKYMSPPSIEPATLWFHAGHLDRLAFRLFTLQVGRALASEIKHNHSPVVIVVLPKTRLIIRGLVYLQPKYSFIVVGFCVHNWSTQSTQKVSSVPLAFLRTLPGIRYTCVHENTKVLMPWKWNRCHVLLAFA